MARGDSTGRVQGDLRLAAFGVFAVAWLRWQVDSSRTWYGAGLTAMPAFSPDPMYLREHLHTVGGPLTYAAAWLSQWLSSPALGAAVLAALAVLVAVATDRLATRLAGRRLPGWRYVPALLFLFVDGHYLHLVDWQLGWIVALLAADACAARSGATGGLSASAVSTASRTGGQAASGTLTGLLRLALATTAVALFYYLLGGAALVAVPFLALVELRRGRHGAAAALLLWPAALPWLSVWCGFDRELAGAYRALLIQELPNDPYGIARAISLGAPAFALLLGALAAGADRPRRQPRPTVAWLGLAASCTLLFFVGADRVQGLRLQLHADAARSEWEAVLAAADRLAPAELTYVDTYAVLLALSHTGRANEVMFRYPVQPYSLLRVVDPRVDGDLTADQLRTQHGLQLCALDLELGLVNEAEHFLHESLETQGTYARLLVPMARIQALQGRPEAARVFLRLAAAQPGDPAGARELLDRLETDPTQEALARNRLQTDILDVESTALRFEQLTAEHPDNRLAWEYRLAWYLLTHQLEKLIAALPSLPSFGRAALPRHVEEAVVYWEALTGRAAELGPWQVRPETRARFAQFRGAIAGERTGSARAAQCWAAPWADTYWYYRLFGTSGAAR